MRNYILALGILLGLCNPCWAAYFQAQTYLPSARTQVSFTAAPYNAVCDGQSIQRVTSISSSSPNLSVTVASFASGDVGKLISVPGAGAGGGFLITTILTFTDSTHVVLAANASTAVSSASVTLRFGTDNSAAFVAFKTAFAGTTPVQLNLPSTGLCTMQPTGSAQRPFIGISDLIVQGTGTSSSGISSISTSGSILLGGSGQAQDNTHSVRTLDAAPSDPCVTLKTTPAITISDALNNLTNPAVFTGSVSTTTMTVTAVASGTITVGSYIDSQGSGITSFTSVLAQLTGTGGAPCPDATCNGGVGTYQISISQTSGLGQMTTYPASFTADFGVTNANQLTVTALSSGSIITPGMFVYSNGGGIGAPMTIAAYGTGGTTGVGSTGTYMLNVPPASGSVTSRGFLGNGQIRLTVSSTSGMTTGDTLFIAGVTASGSLQNRINGLQWITVVDGTHVDLFQQDFNGKYTSGGTAGGDRTALFPVGAKTVMTGWINQAYWAVPFGFPSNPNWFEYRTVASNNSTTHQVCFDAPLAETYKASWPQFNTGSRFQVDPGGPATLYVLDSTWETTIVYNDFTLDAAQPTISRGRSATFNNVVMTGANCVSPSETETMNWINVTGTFCDVEVDKMIKTWNMTNTALLKIAVQSSSLDTTNLNGVTLSGDYIGIGKKLSATNLTVGGQFQIGKTFYGTPQQFSCNTCSIAGVVTGIGTGNRVDSATIPWSMSGGVITIPNAYSLSGQYEINTAQTIPGNYMFWLGSGGGGTTSQYGRVLKIVSVTQDITNSYLTTTEAGGYPTGAWTTSGLALAYHPAPTFSAINMTGSQSAQALNGCTTPMHSCQNLVHTDTSGSSLGTFSPFLLGELDTFTFTNNVPYTGGGTLTWQMSQFNNWPILKTDLTQVNYGASPNGQAIINMKLPSSCGSCTRTLTTSGAVNTQAGDTLTVPPSGALFGGSASSFPLYSSAVNGAEITVTLRTNQNLP